MARESISDKYGDLFIHFANANNADEAIKVFFYDVQKAFNLSNNFPKRAQKLFPGIKQKQLNLTAREKEYLGLIEKRNNLSHIIKELTKDTDIQFQYYDDELYKAFVFYKYEIINDEPEPTLLTIEPNDIDVGVGDLDISDDQKKEMINTMNALLKIENEITNSPMPNDQRTRVATQNPPPVAT